MGNIFQLVFHTILKCIISQIHSFQGPDGRPSRSLSPSEVKYAFFPQISSSFTF